MKIERTTYGLHRIVICDTSYPPSDVGSLQGSEGVEVLDHENDVMSSIEDPLCSVVVSILKILAVKI